MQRFTDKTVILTGASAGVGADAARLFAAEGARLVLAARGRGALDELAATLESPVLTVAMDVADDSACVDLLARAERHFGSVDVLVNNAGCNHRGLVADIEAENLAQIIDVNLRAPVFLTRLVIPYLQRAGGGAIVNVTSIAGKIPVPDEAVYSATKFGLRAFTRALHEELAGSGIRVGCVSPGPIDTGFIMNHLDRVPDYFFAQPVSTARQVAELVLETAADGKVERTIPAWTGFLATAGYLIPPLTSIMRPLLSIKGRRVKQKYIKKYRDSQKT